MAAAVTAGAEQPRPVGSVHEETARLFAALEGAAAAWSRSADGASGPTGQGAGPGVDDHLPSTCGVCPVCLALDRVGRRHPEVLAHLGEAVQALGAALQALTSDARPDDAESPPGTTGTPRPTTERIDVTD